MAVSIVASASRVAVTLRGRLVDRLRHMLSRLWCEDLRAVPTVVRTDLPTEVPTATLTPVLAVPSVEPTVEPTYTPTYTPADGCDDPGNCSRRKS